MSNPPLIAVVGPECTGKTTLSRDLAQQLNGVYLPEYAREYLQTTDYDERDVINIAREQNARELDFVAARPRIGFFDTDGVVNRIWFKERFGRVPTFVDENIRTQPHRLYLLTAPDLEWEFDPLRESPNDRERLFDIYIEELVKLGVDFLIVNGKGEARTKKALDFVSEYFSLTT